MKTIKRGVIVSLLTFASYSVNAGSTYSIATGNYTSNIWSNVSCGGASCGCSGSTATDIVVCKGTTVTFTGAFTVGPGGNVNSLTIDSGGTFITTGDMTFKKNSAVTVAATGTLTVKGNFSNQNNSNNIVINGGMTVALTASFGNGSTITGTGSVAVTGTSSGAGTVYGGSPSGSGTTYSISLPISLLNFTGAYDNDAVSLTWASATETNNDFYSVERSQDGVTFSLIAKIKGAGNSTVTHNYSITDPDPVNGVSYYRLSQTDIDGATTYLNTIPVSVDMNIKGLTLFPNPAKSNILVSFSDAKHEYIQLSVYDYMGKEIYNDYLETARGINTENVTLEKFAPGIYFVTLPVNGKLLKTKFIKN